MLLLTSKYSGFSYFFKMSKNLVVIPVISCLKFSPRKYDIFQENVTKGMKDNCIKHLQKICKIKQDWLFHAMFIPFSSYLVEFLVTQAHSLLKKQEQNQKQTKKNALKYM